MPTMDPLPFWMDFKPSLATVPRRGQRLQGAAAIAVRRAGVSRDRTMAANGFVGLGNRSAGARLGKTWTALLATQVALSLAILPSAMEMLWGSLPADDRRARTACRGVFDGLARHGGRLVSLGHLRIEAVRRLTSGAGISGVTASAVGS